MYTCVCACTVCTVRSLTSMLSQIEVESSGMIVGDDEGGIVSVAVCLGVDSDSGCGCEGGIVPVAVCLGVDSDSGGGCEGGIVPVAACLGVDGGGCVEAGEPNSIINLSPGCKGCMYT